MACESLNKKHKVVPDVYIGVIKHKIGWHSSDKACALLLDACFRLAMAAPNVSQVAMLT